VYLLSAQLEECNRHNKRKSNLSKLASKNQINNLIISINHILMATHQQPSYMSSLLAALQIQEIHVVLLVKLFAKISSNTVSSSGLDPPSVPTTKITFSLSRKVSQSLLQKVHLVIQYSHQVSKTSHIALQLFNRYILLSRLCFSSIHVH
jgi:hypothetical protein